MTVELTFEKLFQIDTHVSQQVCSLVIASGHLPISDLRCAHRVCVQCVLQCVL